MHCGASLAPTAPPTTAVATGVGSNSLQSSFDAQRRRNKVIFAVVGLAAAAAAVLIGLRAAGLLGATDSQGRGDVLTAKGTMPGAVLQAKGTRPDPVLQRGEVAMPADVEAWLKHLEETERRKVLLTRRQTTEFSAMLQMMNVGAFTRQDVEDLTDPDKFMDKTPGQEKVRDIVNGAKDDWLRLDEYFNSRRPPEECRTIAVNYSTGLKELAGNMEDIAAVVDSLNPMSPDLNHDVQAGKEDVYEVGQRHRASVDESFKKALFGVDEVCRKYKKRRWFDIDTSGGGTNILGSFVGG